MILNSMAQHKVFTYSEITIRFILMVRVKHFTFMETVITLIFVVRINLFIFMDPDRTTMFNNEVIHHPNHNNNARNRVHSSHQNHNTNHNVIISGNVRIFHGPVTIINGRIIHHQNPLNHNNNPRNRVGSRRNPIAIPNDDDAKENIENIDPDVTRLPIAICKSEPLISDNKSATYECSVCMDSFEKGAKIMTLPCFHRFHASCITKWFKTSDICPICRHPIHKIH
eukprot:221210_1